MNYDKLAKEQVISIFKDALECIKEQQEKIDKAIEYIQENCTEYGEGKWAYRTINADNVIEILKGE